MLAPDSLDTYDRKDQQFHILASSHTQKNAKFLNIFFPLLKIIADVQTACHNTANLYID